MSAPGRPSGYAIRAAHADDLPRVVLTTFRDVPWNGPYYQRLGFVEVDDVGVGPELSEIRERQAASGLPRAQRVVLAREVTRSE